MSHNTMVDGTVYEISGGRTLVNGTGYSIDKGKTLVGGTVYEVGFAVPCKVTIVFLGISPNGNANVTLNGQTYSAKGVVASPNNYTTIAELTVPSGTVMSCSACTSVGNAKGTIVLNGTNVAEAASAGVTATYDYVVNGNIRVELNDANVVVSNMSVSRVLITEIPEGHALVDISYSIGSGSSVCYVTIDGVKYNTRQTLVVPVGTVIHCYVKISYSGASVVKVNGTTVATADIYVSGKNPYYYGEYDYTVNSDVKINLTDYSDDERDIYITET